MGSRPTTATVFHESRGNSDCRLIRPGLGRCWLNADEPPLAAPVLELHEARNHGVQGVIAAPPNIFPGLMLGAALAHQDRPGIDELSAEALYAQPLSVRIAAIC